MACVVTEGWPHNRPMAGQVGEITHFKPFETASAFVRVRWTRTRSVSSPGASSATTTGSRTAQATADMPTAHAVLDIDAAQAAAEIAAMQAQIAALTAAAGAPPPGPARRVSGYGHVYGAPENLYGAPTHRTTPSAAWRTSTVPTDAADAAANAP